MEDDVKTWKICGEAGGFRVRVEGEKETVELCFFWTSSDGHLLGKRIHQGISGQCGR